MNTNLRPQTSPPPSTPLSALPGPLLDMMREASLARKQGEIERAKQLYRAVTKRYPQFSGAWQYLGTLLHECAEPQEALAALQRARALAPRDHELLCDLAIVLREQKDYAGALEALREAYDCAPEPEMVLEQHARTLIKLEQGRDIVGPLSRYFEHFGENWLLRMLLGECLLQAGSPEQALETLALADKTAPVDESRAILRLAAANLSRGHPEDAHKAYLTARARFPKSAQARIGLASVAAQAGNFEETEKLARKALELNSNAYFAWNLLAKTASRKALPALAEEMKQAAAIAGNDPSAAPLHFARGTVEEKLGHYEPAFTAYALACSLLDDQQPLSIDDASEQVSAIRTNLGPAFLERAAAIGQPDPGVIFVCGMPRSGTTLVESILASHPQVAAGGEMTYIHDSLKRMIGPQASIGTVPWIASADDDALKAITRDWATMLTKARGKQAFITDKMPGNSFLLGFIHVCFPQARIVHVHRDPMDNCLSYFATPFSEGNHLSYSLEKVARHYNDYRQAMAHWHAVLPAERIVDIRYEDVIHDPEKEVRTLLAKLELEWDPRCLDFYKHRRNVATASQFQVRQPLYSSSIGRADHYKSQLAPLAAALESGSSAGSAQDAAVKSAQSEAPSSPATAEGHLQAGEAARERGESAEARAEFEAALTLAPQSASVHFQLARLASDNGEFDRAQAHLRDALKLDPRLYQAWDELSLIESATPSTALVKELDAAISRAPPEDHDARLLYFARGRIREQLGEYEGAFTDYSEGKRPRKAADNYSRDRQTQYTRNIIEHLDRSFVARRTAASAQAPRPIFVCGMFRSGTTLVETILASHPQVAAGGEMRIIHERLRATLGDGGLSRTGNWLAARSDKELADIASAWHEGLVAPAAGHRWITDKMPINYALLGLIDVSFPDAPIVHVRRDPYDTCVSCFATPFDPGAFSTSFPSLGHFYRLYERLMQHWRDVLGPQRIIEIEYESLVRDPENETRRLLNEVGMNWDPRCLEFYKGRHNVNTASVYQVRQPVYSSSIGRAQRFKAHLEPLEAELGAPLDRILEVDARAADALVDKAPKARERKTAPADAARKMQSAVAALQSGAWAEADKLLQSLMRSYPDFADAHHFHGLLLFQRGEKQRGLQKLSDAQRMEPDNVNFLLNYARALQESNELVQSVACFEQAHRLEPDNETALFALAQGMLAMGHGGTLVAELERQAQRHPGDWRIWCLVGQCRERSGAREQALNAFADACKRAPAGEITPHILYADAANRLGHAELARREYEAALAASPVSASATLGLAQLAAQAGDFARAGALLERAVGLDPDFYSAWDWLSLIKSGEPDAALLQRLEAVSLRAGDNEDAWLANFSIGREHEKLGNYDAAFGAYQRGNRLQRRFDTYSRDAQTAYSENLIANLDAKFVARRIDPAPKSNPTPIFLCGMPRSGTTLVESIFAAHPAVSRGRPTGYAHDRLLRALGEDRLQQSGSWLRALSDSELAALAGDWQRSFLDAEAQAGYVTNTIPSNFFILGLIDVCFPNAPIVHVKRDARDTCLSCFTTPFMEGYGFATDLADSAHYYRIYERLMAHWLKTLRPGRIIEVEYETLVNNAEQEIKRLLAAANLQWSARCVEFQNAPGAVHSASVAQVRQPIYAQSIGRWRHFERHLAPLFKALDNENDPLIAAAQPTR